MVALNKGNPLSVAAYARKSREDKEFASIDQQLAACSEFASKYSKYIILMEEHKFGEDNVSGMFVENRKMLQDLLTLVEEGKIKVVLVTKTDRLSRDAGQTLSLMKKLDACGVMLISGDDQGDNSAAGVLAKQVMWATNEFTVRRAIEDTMAAKKRKTEMGFSCGGPGSYGYDVVHKRYIINPQEALTVSRIYDLYIGGNSLREIADILAIEGHHPRMAERFSKATILTILRNERNCGINVWNSQRKRKKRNRISLLEFEEVICDTAIDKPIVTRATFDLAQELLNSRTQGRDRSSGAPGYLLTGLIKCSCGASMIGNSTKGGRNHALRRTYMCSNRKSKRTCSMKDINADYLETSVRELFNEALKEYIEQNGIPQIAVDESTEALNKRIREIKEEVTTNEKLLSRLVIQKAEATADNVIAATDAVIQQKSNYMTHLTTTLQELIERRDGIKKKLENLEDFDYMSNNSLSKELLERYIEEIRVDETGIDIRIKAIK